MKYFLKRISSYFLIWFIALNLLGFLLDFVQQKSNIFKSNRIFKENYNQNIILGSSRALTGIKTPVLNNVTGLKWSNLSIDDSPFELHLLQLQLLINNNKKPKRIILQYDRDFYEKNYKFQLSERDYQFLTFTITHGNADLWNYFKCKEKALGSLLYCVPITKYIYFNTELLFSTLQLLIKPQYTHRSDEFGDYSYPENRPSENSKKLNRSPKNINLNDPLLERFKNLCDSHSIELYVYTAPYLNEKAVFVNNKNLHYLDLSTFYNEPNCFYDELHITNNARDSISITLGNYINNKITR